MKKNQHVTPSGNQWQVKGAGNKKATKIFNTQQEAIDYGKIIAQNKSAELVIHGKNGKIRDKDSYGNDNCPPKDKKN
jgi:hypothetical protein